MLKVSEQLYIEHALLSTTLNLHSAVLGILFKGTAGQRENHMLWHVDVSPVCAYCLGVKAGLHREGVGGFIYNR